MLLFILCSKKARGFYKIRLKTAKFMHKIAIYVKITGFFKNRKLSMNLRDCVILEGVIYCYSHQKLQLKCSIIFKFSITTIF